MNIAKIAGFLAGAGLAATLASPVFAGNTISLNGAFSKNSIVSQTCNSTYVGQTNQATVYTNALSKSSSGLNHMDFNTGGSGSLTSGPASATTGVWVGGSVNAAYVPTCDTCRTLGDTNTITKNGSGSWNSILTVNTSSSVTEQANLFSVTTGAGSEAKSGGNTESFNTDTTGSLTSGGATSETNVTVEAPQNLLNVGP